MEVAKVELSGLIFLKNPLVPTSSAPPRTSAFAHRLAADMARFSLLELLETNKREGYVPGVQNPDLKLLAREVTSEDHEFPHQIEGKKLR